MWQLEWPLLAALSGVQLRIQMHLEQLVWLAALEVVAAAAVESRPSWSCLCLVLAMLTSVALLGWQQGSVSPCCEAWLSALLQLEQL